MEELCFSLMNFVHVITPWCHYLQQYIDLLKIKDFLEILNDTWYDDDGIVKKLIIVLEYFLIINYQ